ncbi:uncharacterized protein FIBRA_05486 [Fibroporia radiculosa]|uniref:Acyl-protein thioesterase 1 n=1 Tax=Fibroporia radiculosa TaxID=599839 RepID=J4HXL9_9APHY|nr:uncharacterized protein FIBRA_05486 [Fibroporia radiculosa]CCM03357.1 predicted protein [Fibroporia radiculosa]
MAVTANGGMEMPSWFDILDFDWRTREDEAGMRKTITSLGTFLDSEVAAGIPANRIVLGGFSQGGAISLLTALTSDKKLGGVTVLSGWLPLHQKIKSMVTSNNVTTPLFWGHGEDDPLVEFDMGVRSVEFLKKEFSIPTADPESPEKGGLMFNSYEDLPHSTSNEELRDLKEWLKKVLPNA